VSDKPRTVSAQIPGESYTRYKNLADARSITLSTFIKEALELAYPQEIYGDGSATAEPEESPPPPEQKAVPQPAPTTSVMGVEDMSDRAAFDLEDQLANAFRVQDQLDPDGPSQSYNQNAARLPVVLQPGGPPIPNEGHPCAYLDPTPPPNMTRADCQGRCKAQSGRPCHWPSQSASGCGKFRLIRNGPGAF
jgi:hypothetical protein